MATRRSQQAERAQDVRGRGGSDAFTLDEVKALVEVLEGTDVTSLRWDRKGHKIVIRRGQVDAVAPFPPSPAASIGIAPASLVGPAPVAAVTVPPAPAPAPTPAPPARAEPAQKPGVTITSPFVGTFYRSPSPDSPPFVEVGTVVKKGQVLCIVEAMKLMNEIEAEAPGRVVEILVQNATPVEFGQPLFRLEPVS